MSYPSVKLGDVCEVLSGYAWSAAKFNTDKIGMPVIRIQNVASVMDCDFVYWDESYDERFVIRTGDIVLTLSGSFRVESWKGPDALLNQRIVKLTPSSKLDERWFLNVLQTRLSEIENLGRHALVNNVSISDIKNLDIPAPPLPEQRRIAAILDQADALRAKRREALVQLDSLTQSIFIEMFGDPLINSKNLPLAKLGDATFFENGDRSSNYPSGDDIKATGVLFLSTKNISNHRLDLKACSFISEKKFDSLSRGKTKKGDILITLRGTLGSSCIFDCPYETAFINAQMMIIRPKPELTSRYLHALLTSQKFQDLFSRIGHGAAVPQLTATQLGHLEIPVPAADEQLSFIKRIDSAITIKSQQEQQLTELNSLFTSLQHRAFRGEL